MLWWCALKFCSINTQFNRPSFRQYGMQLIECYEGVFNTTNHILIAQIKFELGTGLLEQYMDLPVTENIGVKYPTVNNSSSTTNVLLKCVGISY